MVVDALPAKASLILQQKNYTYTENPPQVSGNNKETTKEQVELAKKAEEPAKQTGKVTSAVSQAVAATSGAASVASVCFIGLQPLAAPFLGILFKFL